jgi:predicted PurR-regulated permease PerM
VLFGTALAGVYGAILGIPVVAVAHVILSDVKERRQRQKVIRLESAAGSTLPA